MVPLGLLCEENDARAVDLESAGLGRPIVARSDGTPLYLTRDIAAAVDRRRQVDALSLRVSGNTEQGLRFCG